MNYVVWTSLIASKNFSNSITMAMAAVGISINLSELKSMGYKPFVVGLIAAITVGLVSLYILKLY